MHFWGFVFFFFVKIPLLQEANKRFLVLQEFSQRGHYV